MQYQVPQFTEVEDKIFGPLTFKQFVYVLGAVASVFIMWTLLPKWLAIILGIPIGGFFLALAFLKINEQPLIKVVGNALNFSAGTKIYTWKKEEGKISSKESSLPKESPAAPKLTERKLKELSWSLDIYKSSPKA
ncbi:MAG: PrgI family protein [Candidatus Niyogibacteria bacterium]|nr:PrgI family protein [Candidatus Niyogibacteria bacterium]